MTAAPDPLSSRLLFGTDEPVAPPLALRAGRLSARLRGTRLGPVCIDGHEVWHGVDFLHRDPDWGTPPSRVDAVDHTSDARGFRVRLRGHVDAASRIDFEIAIESDGESLRYEAQAAARGDVATNRTGLVLMHPLAACGRAIEVVHVDGRTSASRFPTLIAPWPPFMLVRAIRHEYADGAWACCRFAGDDFELEDQRNNADASFKTYGRSNLMPRPYVLRAGAPVRQSAQLRIESAPRRARAAADEVQVRIGTAAGALPAVGIGIAPADAHAPPRVRDALRTLAPAFVHLVLDGDEPLDAAALADVLAEAGRPALRVDAIGLDPARADDRLRRVAAALHGAGLAPRQMAAFPSTPPALQAARHAFPHAQIGGGTPFFFTQLNRIEDLGPVDFLSFTTSSVVHGADDEEIMAGLASLPAMIETLRVRHGAVPVHVGPSGIGARRSPLGGQPASDGSRRIALARRDPRTRGLFGAAWALGYVARFAAAGAQALTLFDLQGDAALAPDGDATPAHEILRRLTRPARCRHASVSDPASLAVLSIERDGACETLLANLRGEPLRVRLDGLPPVREAQLMDAEALQRRAADPQAGCWRRVPVRDAALSLPAYAVAFV